MVPDCMDHNALLVDFRNTGDFTDLSSVHIHSLWCE